MWCVVLQPKGTTRNATIPAEEKKLPEPVVIGTILRRASPPTYVGSWKWNAFIVHLFAYKTGKAGTENKHELPPPHDKVLLFGEAVCVATRGTDLVSFGTAEFTKFHNDMFKGFDDIGSEDSEDEEDDEEDAEEDEVAEEDAEDDESESDTESLSDVDDEEEVAPPPVKLPKPKRANKKIPAWFTIPELEPESYMVAATSTSPNRNGVRRVIAAHCDFFTKEQQEDFERGIFNCTIEDAKRRHYIRCVWENPEFQTLYGIVARRSISNMDGKSYVGNTRLLERLRDGEFMPHDIAFMTYSDLYPEKWGTMIEMAIKREAKMLEVDKSMATDMFRCSRCGKRQCTYYEMQTRSADEPMTQFIRCLNCGKQWRQ